MQDRQWPKRLGLIDLGDDAEVVFRQPSPRADDGDAAIITIAVDIDAGRSVDGVRHQPSERLLAARRVGRRPLVMSTPGLRSSRLKLERASGESRSNPMRFKSSSKRLSESKSPVRSNAKVSPERPNRATLSTRVKLRSGRIRKPSAAMTRP